MARDARACAAATLLVALLTAGCATLPPGVSEHRWPDGRVYRGTWQDGQPHGQGVETRPDGTTYNGAWRAGKWHGFGELLTDDGLYQGEFRDGRRHGHGVQFGRDGIYRGDWQDDREHGFGELTGSHGSVYRGEWRAGLRAGEGSHEGANGARYQGEWLDDLPHGHGIYVAPSGTVYSGTWRAGRQHGTGRLVEASGVVYEGAFANALRNGFGIEQRPDGSGYAGEWQDDRRHGQGRETAADGSFHEGAWENGRPLGPGLRRYSTGIEIQGAWNGDTISNGLLKLPDGLEYAGPLFRDRNSRVSPMLVDWVEHAARSGSAYASLLAGTFRLDYAEPASDPGRALAWLRAAADTNVAEAALRIFGVGVNGVGVNEDGAMESPGAAGPADNRTGSVWLERAAALGHAGAHRVLGDLLAADCHAPAGADPLRCRQAALHYRAAVRGGSDRAAERLARLLATAADPTLRDPAEAVAVIEWRALHGGYWRDLETLALALAAGGDPVAAADIQARALAAALPVPGADPSDPSPHGMSGAAAPGAERGTPVPAVSVLINPPPPAPDREAMQVALGTYRSAAASTTAATEPASPTTQEPAP